MEEIKEKLLKRFLKYVKTYSQSDSAKADEGIIPSTPQQFEMAKILCDELKKLGISHGDFAPWNCSIVGGRLFVYDWEDAGPWVDGKDESWFKGQVKKLLGIDA